MNELDTNKTDVLGVRMKDELKVHIPTCVKMRGLTTMSELFRLLLVNECIAHGLMPPMTEDQKRIEVKR